MSREFITCGRGDSPSFAGGSSVIVSRGSSHVAKVKTRLSSMLHWAVVCLQSLQWGRAGALHRDVVCRLLSEG